MALSGPEAVALLARLGDRVALHRKDNTNKFWSYKLRGAPHTEFAFDPRTKIGVYVRVDRAPPATAGVTDIEHIASRSVSTALARVFSGGLHSARFKARIHSAEALLAFIAHCEAPGAG